MKLFSKNGSNVFFKKVLAIIFIFFLGTKAYSQSISPFITTWQTDASKNIIIPLTGAGYDFSINWGDGVTEIKTGTPNNISHNYTTSGVYTVTITPKTLTGFPRIFINNFVNRGLLKTVEQWGGGKWATMERAFYGANTMQILATDAPDFSIVPSFQLAFLECTALTGNTSMGNWILATDPTISINMSSMFQSANNFNQNISNWNVSRVTNMNSMFANTQLFNQDLSAWDVSNITDMASMFNNTWAFNQPLNWGAKIGKVTNMTSMFQSARLFNQDISGWDVSAVTSMASMFNDSRVFNQSLNWGAKTSKVTNMTSMFQSARLFNQDISDWDVSSVTNMTSMFYDAKVFNQDISAWNVSNVTNMNSMFRGMPLFNQPLDAWGAKTAKVTNMQYMFGDSPVFNQNLNSWDVSKVTTTNLMFYRTNSFNQDLPSWNFASLTNGSQMFQENTAFNGNISTWQFTTNTALSINLSNMFNSATKFNQDISGWNVSRVTNMNAMFANTQLFNQDLSAWDVSNVTDMASMFNNTWAFNQPLNWGAKTGKVTNMTSMFQSARLFNQDISGWDVSAVTSMVSMFNDSRVFNQSLNWGAKTSKVTNMTSMFQSARLFNQDISNWDVSSVTNMAFMFYDAKVFNQDISAWNVSNVTNMNSMFRAMPVFNQPLDGWGAKTGKVTNMQDMFRESPVFNQNINSWDVSKVTITNLMFYRTNSFNQDLPSWNFASLTNGSGMFQENTAFNGNITTWKFSTGTPASVNLSSMFQSATAFDKNLGAWDISFITNFSNFLAGTKICRQNYDAILKGWSTLSTGETKIPININISFGSSKYTSDATVTAARSSLISARTWTISDGGVESDYTTPTFTPSLLASNNSTIKVTLSERPYSTCKGTTNIDVNSFTFSVSGGIAKLSSINPTSVTTTDNLTFTLGIGFSIPANGTEILTVNPSASAIFDLAGNEVGTNQTNNTFLLNDLTAPTISGPSSATGSTSIISVNENQSQVFSFTSNEVVLWTLGTSSDELLFNLSSSGVLTFKNSPDFEKPNDTNKDNNYLVEVIATDDKGNVSKQILTITVTDVFDVPATLSNFNDIVKFFHDGPYTISTPTTNSSGAFTYTSSNTNVATISGTIVTLVGGGETIIRATQADDGTFTESYIEAKLTVNMVSVVTKHGEAASNKINFVNKNGALNTNKGVSKNGEDKPTKSN